MDLGLMIAVLKWMYLYVLSGLRNWNGYYYNLMHVECHLISISNLNLSGLFSTERSKRDLENRLSIEIWN